MTAASKLFAAAILLLSTVADGQPPEFEVKGLSLGMAQEQALALYPWVKCSPTHPRYAASFDFTCHGWLLPSDVQFTLGYSPAKIERLEFRENRLVLAWLETDDAGARDAARALAEKYGPVKPYYASQLELFGETCFVVRYAWGTYEKLYADINFPRCGAGGVSINRPVVRRPSKPDV
jgi:hypothetical protein